MKLLSRHYDVKAQDEVNAFDWKFLIPILRELDKAGKPYHVCHSHYIDSRPNLPDYYVTFRIYAEDDMLNLFGIEEQTLLNLLGYSSFDKENERDNGPMTLERIAQSYEITEAEMIEVFKVWDRTSRLKVNLLDLWKDGTKKHQQNGVHYALNSLGLVKQIPLTLSSGITIVYTEEQAYTMRNFPQPTNDN